MILDILDNAGRYLALNRGFAKAFAFLTRPDLKDLPTDRYEIDGDRVFAMVAKEPGRKKEGAQLELHKRYIDIQYILAGTDEMGWKPASSCKLPIGEFDKESDFQFFGDESDTWVVVQPGSYAIFFPEDAHLPLISEGQIHKVVVKIAVDQG